MWNNKLTVLILMGDLGPQITSYPLKKSCNLLHLVQSKCPIKLKLEKKKKKNANYLKTNINNWLLATLEKKLYFFFRNTDRISLTSLQNFEISIFHLQDRIIPNFLKRNVKDAPFHFLSNTIKNRFPAWFAQQSDPEL